MRTSKTDRIKTQRNLNIGLREKCPIIEKVDNTTEYDDFINYPHAYGEWPEPKSPEINTILDGMPDDCLRQIFHHFSQDLRHLEAISAVSFGCHAIAREIFLKSMQTYSHFIKECLYQKPAWFVEKFFQNYGNTLRIYEERINDFQSTYCSEDLLCGFLSKYCGDSLTKLRCVIVEQPTLNECKFTQLQELQLELQDSDGNYKDLSSFLMGSPQLQKLSIEHLWTSAEVHLPVFHFAELEFMKFKQLNFGRDFELYEFFRMNSHVPEIELIDIQN